MELELIGARTWRPSFITALSLMSRNPSTIYTTLCRTRSEMSFLRSQSLLKLCRASNICPRATNPRLSRHISQSTSRRIGEPDPNAIPSDAMQSTEDQASMITVEEAAEYLPEMYQPSHQPDYKVRPDHGTSYVELEFRLAGLMSRLINVPGPFHPCRDVLWMVVNRESLLRGLSCLVPLWTYKVDKFGPHIPPALWTSRV